MIWYITPLLRSFIDEATPSLEQSIIRGANYNDHLGYI